MVVVVAEVVDKELNKVVEEVDNKLVKEFNGGLVKFYLYKVKQIKFEVVVYKGSWPGGHQGGRVGQRGVGWGGHKVDSGHRDDVMLDKEADVEVNQEFDREVADDFIE